LPLRARRQQPMDPRGGLSPGFPKGPAAGRREGNM